MADAFFPSIYPLRFHLETLAAFHVPEYKGSLFRGGFGYFFRDLVCVTRAPACPGCPHLHTCSYSTVFESPVAPERIGVLRKYPNAPHPFVMAPPLDARTLLPAGTDLSLDITLIGEGVKTLPHFLVVFEEMGRSGRFGGKFRLRAVHSALPAAQPVFDGVTRRIAESVPPWIAPPEPPPPQRAHLSFLTPLRMRTGGVYNRNPDFVSIAHALLRRIHLLAAIYGEGTASTDWMKPLLASADQVRSESSTFSLYPWQRASGRQHRSIAMDGVIGKITVGGDLDLLWPWLRLGEWIHVGPGRPWGWVNSAWRGNRVRKGTLEHFREVYRMEVVDRKAFGVRG